MKKHTLLFFTCFFAAAPFIFAQSPAVIREYIEKYKDAAVQEMIRSGVPASITLAQGIHETDAGRSALCLKSNNHFGIKCKTEWGGESVSHDDDAKGECFRKYTSPFDSYRDHSDFLKKRPNYASLFNLDPTDYEAWAWGLKKAGYATNPRYPQILIKLIQDYNLQDYTLIALGRKPADHEDAPKDVLVKINTPPVSDAIEGSPDATVPSRQNNYPQGVFKINETPVVYAAKGTSFLALAEEHNISLSRLFDFNDMQSQEAAPDGQLIYLQRKRRTGLNETHTVAAGETLRDIAQSEAIRLEYLLEYNFLKAGMQPAEGEVLQLQRKAAAPPRLSFAVNNRMVAPPTKKDDVTAETKSIDYIVHTVQPKETVYSIAKRYAVAQEDVIKWNELPGKELKIGQQLRIKKKA